MHAALCLQLGNAPAAGRGCGGWQIEGKQTSVYPCWRGPSAPDAALECQLLRCGPVCGHGCNLARSGSPVILPFRVYSLQCHSVTVQYPQLTDAMTLSVDSLIGYKRQPLDCSSIDCEDKQHSLAALDIALYNKQAAQSTPAQQANQSNAASYMSNLYIQQFKPSLSPCSLHRCQPSCTLL